MMLNILCPGIGEQHLSHSCWLIYCHRNMAQSFGPISQVSRCCSSAQTQVKKINSRKGTWTDWNVTVGDGKTRRMTARKGRGFKVINSVCQHPQNPGREVAFQSLRKLINAFSLKAANLHNLCSLSLLNTSLYQRRVVMKTERVGVCSAYGAASSKARGHEEARVHEPGCTHQRDSSENAHELREKPDVLNIALKWMR